ncbi:hypothetical protein LSAT2_002240, partial [Lamellibrachia satsuma]
MVVGSAASPCAFSQTYLTFQLAEFLTPRCKWCVTINQAGKLFIVMIVHTACVTERLGGETILTEILLRVSFVECFDIGSKVGKNVYCRFDETCTSVSCCVDLKLFIYRHTLTAFVRYDPCDLELTLGFNKWTASFKVLEEDFTVEDSVLLSTDVNALNVVRLMLDFKIHRTTNAIVLKAQIENFIENIFGNEFELFDICTTGLELSFGPYYIEIYRLNPPIVIPIGPIPLTFMFGVDGHYGATFNCRLCFMTMKATAKVVPRIGSSVWGSVGVSILVLRAELRLTGYLLTTSFPTIVTIEFKKFPLEVRARMDLNLIPLRIELRALLIFRFCIYIPWKGKKCWKKTLLNFLLWHYQTKAINKNLINYNDAEPDLTAPDFGWYSQAECSNCDTPEKRRRRRSVVSSNGACNVAQIEGRDYTEPAFNIEFGVADDRSEVELSYCVGTFSGGCDVVDNEPLGGASTVVVRRMVHSIRLYFRVKAKNSMGLSTMTSCELPTYDMTLPEGRITADFSSTSHPELLQGSALALDDSVIVTQKISAGYGKGSHGTHIVDWQSVESVKAVSVNTGHDPNGLQNLQHFT